MAIILPNQADVTEPKYLNLCTRKGNLIRNEVGPEDPGYDGRTKYRVERERHPNWRMRRGACGIYNCWGMLFTGRRTGIWCNEVVQQVIKEDGYRQVESTAYNNDVKPGDLVIYYSYPSRMLLHGGVVFDVRPPEAGKVLPRIHVLSKWTGWSGEDFHDVEDVCVMMVKGSYSWEIWTDRPNDANETTRAIVLA